MTTEQLEQLMQAHKCGFTIATCDEGYDCELTIFADVIAYGTGPSIVEAVYEALKSKLGQDQIPMFEVPYEPVKWE